MTLPPTLLGVGRPLSRTARAALTATLAFCALAYSAARTPVAAAERGPELILPGDHMVRPGQWIDLRWTAADRIAELEILLSLDGGRHYSVCISPQLDPGLCRFVWRVPDYTGQALRMRIRFNRGGREIEGAPSGPLVVSAGTQEQPEPLGLPPMTGGAGDRGPEPRSRGGALIGRAHSDAASDDERARRRACRRDATLADVARIPLPTEASTGAPFAAPRAVPLRA
jgi:hypothetical protein